VPKSSAGVGAAFRQADREPYRRLDDVVCACAGEVRAPTEPGQEGPELVVDVAELIWEPIAD
jgi:hypothetical protein